MATVPNIPGFRKAPKKAARGIYKGRFTCQDVQWTGTASDIIATFTITADELADTVEGGLVWTDQDVQRGIQPTAIPRPPRELSLAAGYPDPNKYVFDTENADHMVEKLLAGERIFFNPLVGTFGPIHSKHTGMRSRAKSISMLGKSICPILIIVSKRLQRRYGFRATRPRLHIGLPATANSKLSCIFFQERTRETIFLIRTIVLSQ